MAAVIGYLEGRASRGGDQTQAAATKAEGLSKSSDIGIATTATLMWVHGLRSQGLPLDPAMKRAKELEAKIATKKRRTAIEDQWLEMLRFLSQQDEGAQDNGSRGEEER